LRIALFHPCLIPAGIPRVFVNLARGFMERGHVVDLVQATPGGDFRSEVPEGVRLVDLNCRRALTSVIPLARYLHREKPDVVISGAIQTNIAAVCATRVVRARPQLILTEHNIVSVVTKDAPMLRTRITPTLIRVFYPIADEIVAVSEGAAADLEKILRAPARRVRVIYNPIISEQFWERAKAPLTDEVFESESRPIILAVGRLHYHKDYPTLLRAFARVRKKIDAKLVFLGSGEEQSALLQTARELKIDRDVEFLGNVRNPLPYMKAASALALSSQVEALPTVLIEALALGLPIVATDCPAGPREILGDGAYGTLVPVGDDSKFADALLNVLSQPRTCAAPAEALSRFQHDCVVDQYLSLANR
jgi:glycosyltransferase involved in cell wall biosynthesis